MTEKLVEGETMGRADREREIRAAIDRIFDKGCPDSVIVMAGAGNDVRVAWAGSIADLRALSLLGMAQVIHALDNATGPVPRRLDS